MKKKNLILLLLALIFFPLLKAVAFCLNYNLPDEINLNEDFKVEVSLSDKEVFVESLEGVLSFDAESFEFLGFNSSFNDWIEPPFLNVNEISFRGVFNSFLTDNIFTLNFKKINNTDFDLKLTSGIILEEERLSSLEGINFLKESLFNVSSETHPDSNTWYNQKKVKLNWTVPKDALKIKVLIDENEFSYPSVEYGDPIIEEKEIELDDGIFYFHIRYFGKNGWSEIENKRIMIDTKKPEDFNFLIQENKIQFGEKYLYEIEIPSLAQKYSTSKSFDFSFLKSGEYETILRAYDLAGNYLEKEILLEVEKISSPQFSSVILEENNLYISGYLEAKDVKVITSIDGEDFENQEILDISPEGKFVYYVKDLKPGLYDLKMVTIKDNNLSEENKKIILIIDEKLNFRIIAEILIAYGIMILIFLLLHLVCKKNKKRNKKIKNKKYEL